MYRSKIWDDDKWNIHSNSYGSSKYSNSEQKNKNDQKYEEQRYGPRKKSLSSDSTKKEYEREKGAKPDVLKGDKGAQNDSLNEAEIPLRAAKEIFNENAAEKKPEIKKDTKSIEEAIKKAIEDEKKVI